MPISSTPPLLLALLVGPQSPVQVPNQAGLVRHVEAQAGQLLSLWARGPATGGTISGSVLTGGAPLGFDEVAAVEFDAATGGLQLRVPPREVGPIEVSFVGSPLAPPPERVEVEVLPPNLYDGVRVDGTFDGFETALTAPSSLGGSMMVAMFDPLTLLPAGSISAWYSVATDAKHVYLTVRWEDPTEDREFDLNVDLEPQRTDGVSLWLDQDTDGLFETGEDFKIAFPYLTGSGYIDGHYLAPTGTAADEVTANGNARMDYDAASGSWTVELLLPRATDAAGEDAVLAHGTLLPFNVIFEDGTGPAATAPRVGGLFGYTGGDASGWGLLPLPPPLAASYAPVAEPALGALICISNHEHPKGELYDVDLATGDLVRLTNNDRYEDWISVAPDGSFAAYGASTDQTAFSGYDIWRWDRGTGLETQLTDNDVLEGHPAIAPNGSAIAYVAFNPDWTADIYVMDAAGTQVVRITDDAIEQNDPEWTKDGLLVIKSAEWTGFEQLALMNLAGITLLRLTDNVNSDHDAFVTPDNAWALYERFEGTGPWSADWNLTNSTPWTIRMVALDGTRDSLLVDDGLVNWLPVMGPDGIIAYYKNTAFNGLEVRMIDRFGVDLGRLVPRQSQIRYMDWK